MKLLLFRSSILLDNLQNKERKKETFMWGRKQSLKKNLYLNTYQRLFRPLFFIAFKKSAFTPFIIIYL